MAITGEQLRMARAALKLTTREVAEMSGIDKSTIVRAEAGGKAYYNTIVALQATLEAAGIEFLDPIEGVAGPGVRLKWGAEIPRRGESSAAAGKESESGMNAAPWDDFAEGEPIPPEIESLRTYWRGHPGEWAALAEVSRFALLQEMRLDSLGAEMRGQA